MPGGDRTGPMGLGPMTGRAAGICAGYPTPGFANPIPGFGRGRGFYPYAYPNAYQGYPNAYQGYPNAYQGYPNTYQGYPNAYPGSGYYGQPYPAPYAGIPYAPPYGFGRGFGRGRGGGRWFRGWGW